MMPNVYRHRDFSILRSLAVVCALLCFAVASGAAQIGTVTLRIPHQDLFKLKGISVLNRTDYEGFSIVEIPESAASKLKSASYEADQNDFDTVIGLRGHRFDTRSGAPTIASALKAIEKPGNPMLYLIQLKGPAKPEWLSQIKAAGAQVIGYIPQNAYLVWLDPASIQEIGKKSFVRWKSAYHPAYKIDKGLERAEGNVDFSVLIYGENPEDTISQIESMSAKLLQKTSTPFGHDVPGTTAVFSADVSLVAKIAKLSHVVRLEKAGGKVVFDDEVACQIMAGHTLNGVPYSSPSYRSWLQETGIDGTGSRVAIVDTGCDTNNNATVHPDLRGRITFLGNYPWSYDEDVYGHGTHVAGIIAGNGSLGTTDENGFLFGLGVAPGANLFIQNPVKAQFPPGLGQWDILTKDAVRNQAWVSNNSWSWENYVGVGYSYLCKIFDTLVRDADPDVDGSQPLTIVFSAGNNGPEPSSMAEPKELKNAITVGASESYRPSVILGGDCGPSDNINGLATFSSRGPCIDGRISPTVVAPGTNIASTVSYAAIASGEYDRTPCTALATQDYVWMSGTSQSAPMVTGAVALFGQWWRSTHSNANPSPAMCKAIVVNSADDIAGGPDARGGVIAHIPNNDQGWGRLNIKNAINPPGTFYDDQSTVFTETGQTRRYLVQAVDPGKPLKITLTWTDAAGTPGADAWVNDLDLTATSGTTTYRGNVFSNGWSVSGGSRDYKNNVECIYIEHPTDAYWVTVTAANIAGDGVPDNSTSLDQDYAIVMRNARVGGDTLEPYQTVTETTPAKPDYYRVQTPSGGWFAVGVRSSALNDSDVALFSDSGFVNQVATSNLRGNLFDFIAVDGNRALNTVLHPLVNKFSGSAGYQIELATKTAELSPGLTTSSAFDSSNFLRVWDVTIPTAGNCAIRVQPTSGQMDLGLSVFGSTSGLPSSYCKSRGQRLAEADLAGANQPETLVFQVPSPGKYGVVVWSKSGEGNYSVLFDDDPPTTANIILDYTYTTDLTSMAAVWSANDLESDITNYQYCIGTTPGASNVVAWTNNWLYTRVIRHDLNLVSGNSYYITVRATNGLGLTSQSVSPPMLAVQATSTIAAAKGLQDGKGLVITSKASTATFAGRFYISETDRASGIGVIWPSGMPEGRFVTVVGTMTTIDGERFIRAKEVFDLGPVQ